VKVRPTMPGWPCSPSASWTTPRSASIAGGGASP
jgi:hypothetical protein